MKEYPPEYEKVSSYINDLIPNTKLEFTKKNTSSITTAWGVQWDETQIARDLLQNFFDANRENISSINIEVINKTDVIISAPDRFNLERLFYLGSEKGKDDIGQYGEGFKAAATCLLRDHDVTPVAISGNQLVHLSLSSEKVKDTSLRPIDYFFYELSEAYPRTKLILPNCPKDLVAALKQGLNHFFYDGNQLIGEEIEGSCSTEGFRLYRSTSSEKGYVFYKNLMRGAILNIPIVMVIDKEYKSIENKIQKDRDRNAFGDDLMDIFYGLFATKLYKSGVKFILDAARKIWVKGHPLLSTIAEKTIRDSNWDISELFEDEYFAKTKIPKYKSIDSSQQIEIESLDKQWIKEGRTKLPAYFTKFGLMSALEAIEERDRKALNEEIEKQVSSPSLAELKGIEVLKDILEEFSPVITSFFKERTCNYRVGQTETILGALRRKPGYLLIEVYLAADIFTSDLARALAVFLHEHSHIFGNDGSRGFTDALTELLESIVRNRDILDEYDSKWEQIRELVSSERANQTNNDPAIKDILLKMDREKLLQLLEQMPQATLRNILSSQGIS